MKIKVENIHPTGSKAPKEFVLPLITEPHNIRYDHTKHNCAYFRVLRYPTKRIHDYIAMCNREPIKLGNAYLRVCIKVQTVTLLLDVHYNIIREERPKQSEISRKMNVEKSELFWLEYTADELKALFEPRLEDFKAANGKHDAELFVASYIHWANPQTLYELAGYLTKKQKDVALRMLLAYFAPAPKA